MIPSDEESKMMKFTGADDDGDLIIPFVSAKADEDSENSPADERFEAQSFVSLSA